MSSSWAPRCTYVPRHARRQLLSWAPHATFLALALLALVLGR